MKISYTQGQKQTENKRGMMRSLHTIHMNIFIIYASVLLDDVWFINIMPLNYALIKNIMDLLGVILQDFLSS